MILMHNFTMDSNASTQDKNQKELQTAIYAAIWKIKNTENKHRKILTHLSSINRAVNEIMMEHTNNTSQIYKHINIIRGNKPLQFCLNSITMKNQINIEEFAKQYRVLESTILNVLHEENSEKQSLEHSMQGQLNKYLETTTSVTK